MTHPSLEQARDTAGRFAPEHKAEADTDAVSASMTLDAAPTANPDETRDVAVHIDPRWLDPNASRAQLAAEVASYVYDDAETGLTPFIDHPLAQDTLTDLAAAADEFEAGGHPKIFAYQIRSIAESATLRTMREDLISDAPRFPLGDGPADEDAQLAISRRLNLVRRRMHEAAKAIAENEPHQMSDIAAAVGALEASRSATAP